MFENLPQLSETTREVIMGEDIDSFGKLPEPEAQNQVNQELAQLEQINQWVAVGVSFIAYCIEQVDDSVQHDSDIHEEVKSFWETFGPYIRTRCLKAALVLLKGIDKELWIKDMERCCKSQ